MIRKKQQGRPYYYAQFRHKILNMFFPPRIVAVLEKLPEKHFPPFQSMYLFGDTGVGKTIYACRRLEQQIKSDYSSQKKGVKYAFVSLTDYLQYCRAQIEGNAVQSPQSLRQATYLIVDDIAADKVTEWTHERVYELVNYRYENQLQTIYTSNLSLEELGELYDQRIISRIIEDCIITNMKGRNYRDKTV